MNLKKKNEVKKKRNLSYTVFPRRCNLPDVKDPCFLIS